jgi:hypothetical protein
MRFNAACLRPRFAIIDHWINIGSRGAGFRVPALTTSANSSGIVTSTLPARRPKD